MENSVPKDFTKFPTIASLVNFLLLDISIVRKYFVSLNIWQMSELSSVRDYPKYRIDFNNYIDKEHSLIA